MPVMLIRVMRDCYVLSGFYDVNRVLFKDGRVLSRFLITSDEINPVYDKATCYIYCQNAENPPLENIPENHQHITSEPQP